METTIRISLSQYYELLQCKFLVYKAKRVSKYDLEAHSTLLRSIEQELKVIDNQLFPKVTNDKANTYASHITKANDLLLTLQA